MNLQKDFDNSRWYLTKQNNSKTAIISLVSTELIRYRSLFTQSLSTYIEQNLLQHCLHDVKVLHFLHNSLGKHK